MIRSLVMAPLLLSASFASAQAFEYAAADSIRSFSAQDAFADVGACGVLDIKTIRAIALDEAEDMVQPCVEAALAKYGAKAAVAAGFLNAPQSGKPVRPGLLVKTDLVPGSAAHRDLVAALERREGQLLGHPARVLTRGEAAPSAVSALQAALADCMVVSVVRDVRSGDDFVKLYGRCLTRNPDLKIKEIRAAEGLAVTLSTDADRARVESYNGFVTVNAGKGPVAVMVVAYAAQVALP